MRLSLVLFGRRRRRQVVHAKTYQVCTRNLQTILTRRGEGRWLGAGKGGWDGLLVDGGGHLSEYLIFGWSKSRDTKVAGYGPCDVNIWWTHDISGTQYKRLTVWKWYPPRNWLNSSKFDLIFPHCFRFALFFFSFSFWKHFFFFLVAW